MFIEIVDALRCPRAHADSWLVGAFDQMRGRDIIQGSLGCPVCDTRYAIRDGAVFFDELSTRPDAGSTTANVGVRVDVELDRERGMYLGALLGLADGRGIAVLEGEWTRHAESLRSLTAISLILLNPASAVMPLEGAATVFSRDAVPLATGGARGIALSDAGASDTGIMHGAVRALGPLGRLLAPVRVGMPMGIHELARDGECWVGERESTASAPVTIGRTGAR